MDRMSASEDDNYTFYRLQVISLNQTPHQLSNAMRGICVRERETIASGICNLPTCWVGRRFIQALCADKYIQYHFQAVLLSKLKSHRNLYIFTVV